MVQKPFIIEHIPVQLRLRRLPYPLILLHRRRRVVFLSVKLIAFVIPSRTRIMIRPRPHSKPTKIMSTTRHLFPTGHVVTALILLDRLTTSRALLGVGYYPRHVFRLRAVFQIPFTNDLA
jgi:hypothetical protein